MTTSQDWTPPRTLGEYRLLKVLGAGAMGQVWLAEDTLLERPVAIKFATALGQAEPRLRFRIEARAIARLRHPNVIAVHHAGEVDERPFLVTEVLSGKSLDRLTKPLEVAEAVAIGVQLARGLAVAHRAGILHRDIKPANAFQCDDGTVKLLDFGLAKLADPPQSDEALDELARHEAAAAQVRWAPALPADSPAATAAEATVGSTPRDGAIDTTAVSSRATTLPGSSPGKTWANGAATKTPTAQSSSDTRTTAPEPLALTTAGALVGTPLYMAPELWRGQPATQQSDVYALGAVLYELLSGRPPFSAPNLLALRFQVMTEPLVHLHGSAGIPDRLATLVSECLAKEPPVRPGTDELRDRLEEIELLMKEGAALVGADLGTDLGAETSVVTTGTSDGNPYRGLLPFQREHAGLFFGREAETRAVLAELRIAAVVAVTGPSGSGKSSLVRASVAPAVERGALGAGTWRVVTLVPGRRPLEALAEAAAGALAEELAAAGVSGEAELLARLQADAAWLGRTLRAQPSRVLVIVDQLEEVATVASAPARAGFVAALSELAASAPAVRVLCTLRSDSLGRLGELGDLRAELLRSTVVLGPLGHEGLRRAIVEPARRRGYQLESVALVDRLVEEGARGSLAVLQFALAALWEARDRDKRRLTAQALDEMGGLEGALARHAEAVLGRFPPGLGRLARDILVSLVTLEGQRSRRSEAEIVAWAGTEARAALEALVEGRLLVVGEGDEGPVYELVHDALLTGWPWLRAWLEAESEARLVEARLSAAAAEWERLGKSDDALWRGRQLLELSAIEGRRLPARDEAFVVASRRAARRERWRQRGLRYGALALLVVLGLTVWLGSALQNRRRATALVAQAQERAARAQALEAEERRLRREALAAFDRNLARQAEASWKEALRRAQLADRLRVEATQLAERALDVSPGHLAAREVAAEVLLARFHGAERMHERDRAAQLRSRLQIYDRGKHLAALDRPARVEVETVPAATRLQLRRYERDEQDRLVPGKPRTLPTLPAEARAGWPMAAGTLAPGSYVLEASAPGRQPTVYPFVVSAGEQRRLRILLPRASEVPAGFVYVPEGRFLYGSADDEETRRLLDAQPAHIVEQPAFLIKQTEVSYGEYLEFLRALPPAERALRRTGRLLASAARPEVQWGFRAAEGRVLGPTEPHCPSEGTRCVAWPQLPFDDASFDDATAYVRWLDASGRVKGARLCTDREWERAARGADERTYPHGFALRPGDACTLSTLGGDRSRGQACLVGQHPRSRSPFGVDDLVGNVWEWTSDSPSQEQPTLGLARGSSWEADDLSLTVINRAPVARATSRLRGIRVCAPAPPP